MAEQLQRGQHGTKVLSLRHDHDKVDTTIPRAFTGASSKTRVAYSQWLGNDLFEDGTSSRQTTNL